jgi:hypothetical protein
VHCHRYLGVKCTVTVIPSIRRALVMAERRVIAKSDEAWGEWCQESFDQSQGRKDTKDTAEQDMTVSFVSLARPIRTQPSNGYTA